LEIRSISHIPLDLLSGIFSDRFTTGLGGNLTLVAAATPSATLPNQTRASDTLSLTAITLANPVIITAVLTARITTQNKQLAKSLASQIYRAFHT
jgi:hypothetical protein